MGRGSQAVPAAVEGAGGDEALSGVIPGEVLEESKRG